MNGSDLLPRTFQALSDPMRLRMFRLFAVNRTKMCVCEFVDSLEERQYNVSRHLKLLGIAGLLRKEKEGRRAYYGLEPANPIISAFSRLVASLPDPDGTFARDQVRFEEQAPFRQGGDRCRQCTTRRKRTPSARSSSMRRSRRPSVTPRASSGYGSSTTSIVRGRGSR